MFTGGMIKEEKRNEEKREGRGRVEERQ